MHNAAACAQSQPSAYQRHIPEETILYKTIQQHLNTFIAQCESMDKPVPTFVQKELEAYLRCGILAHGFARIYCHECHFDRLVALSCKKRGFCMSCIARRNSETAAHLVDSVIPHIPTRQWVLSVPMPLRFLIAFDSRALKVVIDAFTAGIFSWLKRKANEQGIVLSAKKMRPGSVTFVQRFGSALNLNVHLHAVFSDGVYLESDTSKPLFEQVPAPTLADIRHITEKIARRVHRWLEQRMNDSEIGDDFAQKEPLLSQCYAASMRYLTALGKCAGQPLMRVIAEMDPENKNADREARTVLGYNMHASIPIEAHDRRGLEKLLRYMGRPPLSEERLKLAPDGRIIVKLKTAWSDGTQSVILTPLELIERLVALVPPPHKNQLRYHGIFAPNSKLRKAVVPPKAEPENATAGASDEPSGKNKSYAVLMARVFEIDVLACPRCNSRMKMISFITEHKVIRNILASLKMATAPPEVAKATIAAEQESFSFDYAE
jgi:hypothetical protein